jgi:hypothetical protein
MPEMRPTRERSCSTCGKAETVRADNPAKTCRKCAASANGALGAVVKKTMFPRNACGHCGKSIRRSRLFCDQACDHASRRAETMAPLPILKTTTSTELELSRAAEFLVCAELILAGYPAFPSAAGLPYDVVVDLGDRLIKLQVKATRGPRAIPQRAKYTPGYLFHTKRCGAKGRNTYQAGDFDGYALVALDTRAVAYIPLSQAKFKSVHLRPAGFAGAKWSRRKECITDFPFETMLAALS